MTVRSLSWAFAVVWSGILALVTIVMAPIALGRFMMWVIGA